MTAATKPSCRRLPRRPRRDRFSSASRASRSWRRSATTSSMRGSSRRRRHRRRGLRALRRNLARVERRNTGLSLVVAPPERWAEFYDSRGQRCVADGVPHRLAGPPFEAQGRTRSYRRAWRRSFRRDTRASPDCNGPRARSFHVRGQCSHPVWRWTASPLSRRRFPSGAAPRLRGGGSTTFVETIRTTGLPS